MTEDMHEREMEKTGRQRDYGSKNGDYRLNSDVPVSYIRDLFGLTRSANVTDALDKLNADRIKKEEEA